jgi:sphingomyelin phosphodiesterase
MNKRIYIIISAVLLLLNSTFAAPRLEKDTSDILPQKNLKILSWNIYMLPGIVPMKGRIERAHAIVDTLDHLDYDVIVFQEAFHGKAVSVIREGLKNIFPHMYGPFNPAKSPFRISSGVWVLSKIPLDLLGTIEYTDAKVADRVPRKGAALLQGNFNGKVFQILGTHMQAQNFPEIRKKQFKEMYDGLLSKYKVEGIPQIICGDMNTEIEIEKNYCEMLQCLDAENGDMNGIQKESYDGTNNELALSVWKKEKTTLDYILFRNNGAKIHSVKRSVSVFKRQWKKGKHDLSDHYGVMCEVKF